MQRPHFVWVICRLVLYKPEQAPLKYEGLRILGALEEWMLKKLETDPSSVSARRVASTSRVASLAVDGFSFRVSSRSRSRSRSRLFPRSPRTACTSSPPAT